MFDELLSAIGFTAIGLVLSFIWIRALGTGKVRLRGKSLLFPFVWVIVGVYGIGEVIWTEIFPTPKSGEEIRREQIMTWAKTIVDYENRVNVEMTEFYNLNEIFSRRDLTEAEISRLLTCQQNLLAISKDARYLEVPSKVSKTHELMIEYYTKNYELLFNYNQGIKYIDESYFKKATSLAEDVDNIGNISYNQFIKLMNEFNIACTEINFCE